MKRFLLISMFAALLMAGCGRDIIIINPSQPSGQTPDNSGNDNPDDNNNDNPSDNPNNNPSDDPSGDDQEIDPNCIIYYTSSDGKIIEPYSGSLCGGEVTTDGYLAAYILENIYENGVGMIICNRPIVNILEINFRYCSTLTSITLPESVKSVERSTFRDSYDIEAFYGKFASADNKCLVCDGVLIAFARGSGLTEYNIPAGITTIASESFCKCESITNINIGNDVLTIEYAFADCINLRNVNISNGVISIGSYAFEYCSNLKSINIPDSVMEIGKEAFVHCSSLTSITIPNNVISIEKYTFYNCSSLASITIPERITSIGEYSFFGCSSLTSVYCRPTTPPTLGRNVFKEDNPNSGNWSINNNLQAIYVPRESVEAYKMAKDWSDYADLIVGFDF